MILRATFPEGVDATTVHGLHQWDYGQTIEIYLPDGPASVEVHFACEGMDEAVVRACETTSGKAVVAIPDRCLEQTAPVTAWVFEIDGTSGTTTKKIILPIEARTRPSIAPDVPTEVYDKYTEFVTSVNDVMESIHSVADGAADEINGVAQNFAASLFPVPTVNTTKKLTTTGLYYIHYVLDNELYACGIIYWSAGSKAYFPSYTTYYNTSNYSRSLSIDTDGALHVYQRQVSGGTSSQIDYTEQCLFYTSKIGGTQ